MVIPLQEPVLIWSPFVKVFPVQKLMKLAGSVKDGDCPASALADPSESLAFCTFEASRINALEFVVVVFELPPPVEAVEFVPVAVVELLKGGGLVLPDPLPESFPEPLPSLPPFPPPLLPLLPFPVLVVEGAVVVLSVTTRELDFPDALLEPSPEPAPFPPELPLLAPPEALVEAAVAVLASADDIDPPLPWSPLRLCPAEGSTPEEPEALEGTVPSVGLPEDDDESDNDDELEDDEDDEDGSESEPEPVSEAEPEPDPEPEPAPALSSPGRLPAAVLPVLWSVAPPAELCAGSPALAPAPAKAGAPPHVPTTGAGDDVPTGPLTDNTAAVDVEAAAGETETVLLLNPRAMFQASAAASPVRPIVAF